MSTVSFSGERATNGNKKGRLFELKTRLKKKKRRKDLEQIRRNVLAAKRTFRRRSLQAQRSTSNKLSKNSLKKTLNMFAGIRQENENKTQGLMDKKSSKKLKGKMICARLLPDPVIGIFKNGAKGNEARRKTATNFPLYRTNEARLHNDVLELLNGDENYSSSNKTSLDNRDDSDHSNENEKCEDKRDFYSILHHQFSPDHAIKSKCTFNNESRLKNSGNERAIESPDLLKNVQRVDKYKKFMSRPSLEDCDYDTTPTIEHPDFTRRKHNEDDDLMRKQLPRNAIGNKMQSIKRWGICPVLCYDEFCSKIHDEQFSFPETQCNSSDPIIEIRAALSALYAEAYEQQTDTNITSKVSSTSSNSIVTQIELSNQSPIIHNNPTSLIEPNSSSNSSFIQSCYSKYSTAKSAVKFTNELHNHEPNLWEINEIASQCSENRLKFFINDEESCGEYTKYQADKSLDFDYTAESSPSKAWRATTDKQKTLAPRNVKYIPTILRRGNSRRDHLVDLDLSEYHEINDFNHFQGSQNKTGTLKHHLLDGKTNISLTPSVVINVKNGKKPGKKYSNTETTRIQEFTMLNDEFVTPYRSDINDDYFNRIKTTKHKRNKNIPTFNEAEDINNIQQFPHSSSWDFNPPLTESLIVDDTVPLIQPNDNEFHSQNTCYDIYPRNIVKANSHLSNINQSTSLPHHRVSKYCNGYIFESDMNSGSLTNKCCIIPHNAKISRVKSVDQSHWRASNFGHNVNNNKATLLPINHQDTLRHYGRHYSNANVDINGPVLQYFKSLSFHENNTASSLVDHSRCCRANKGRRTPDTRSNLHHPSKYYAVTKECDIDQIPRRVPVYLNDEKTQFMKEEQPCGMNVLKKSAGKCIATTYKLNFDSDMKDALIHDKNQNNSRSIPSKCSRHISDNNSNGLEIPIETSLKSKAACDACEILLDDGRIGLFLPRTHHQSHQLKHHSLNKYSDDQHTHYYWG